MEPLPVERISHGLDAAINDRSPMHWLTDIALLIALPMLAGVAAYLNRLQIG